MLKVLILRLKLFPLSIYSGWNWGLTQQQRTVIIRVTRILMLAKIREIKRIWKLSKIWSNLCFWSFRLSDHARWTIDLTKLSSHTSCRMTSFLIHREQINKFLTWEKVQRDLNSRKRLNLNKEVKDPSWALKCKMLAKMLKPRLKKEEGSRKKSMKLCQPVFQLSKWAWKT